MVFLIYHLFLGISGIEEEQWTAYLWWEGHCEWFCVQYSSSMFLFLYIFSSFDSSPISCVGLYLVFLLAAWLYFGVKSVFFLFMCRLKLILEGILYMSMEIGFRRDCLQRFILPLTSQKGNATAAGFLHLLFYLLLLWFIAKFRFWV